MNAWQQQKMETIILVEGEIKFGHNHNMLGILAVPILWSQWMENTRDTPCKQKFCVIYCLFPLLHASGPAVTG
jgi:hypothetical protein